MQRAAPAAARGGQRAAGSGATAGMKALGGRANIQLAGAWQSQLAKRLFAQEMHGQVVTHTLGGNGSRPAVLHRVWVGADCHVMHVTEFMYVTECAQVLSECNVLTEAVYTPAQPSLQARSRR